MPTIEQLQRQIRQLEYELIRQGVKLEEKIELLKQSIPKAEHKKVIEQLKKDYE